MPQIPYSGQPDSKVWIIAEKPYDKDYEKNELFSSPYGWVWRKVWNDANISIDPFYICLRPDTTLTYDDFMQRDDIVKELNRYKPPFILPMGKRVTALFCPATIVRKKGKKNVAPEDEYASLDKYAGSLLVSPHVNYEHYCIPQYPPDYLVADWSYRDICVNLDLGHVREEVEYYEKNGTIQPLTHRDLVIKPTYEKLMDYLSRLHGQEYLSVDIETIRPPKGSVNFKEHPGYPYTIAIAPSPFSGISFSFWDYDCDSQLGKIWRELDFLLGSHKQIGQNYFSFDTHFLEALGFNILYNGTQDTLIRHHILWPELEHKLQFLTKQYTRQPYYKDEGKTWSPKNKAGLMHYNALDATVTYEVFLGQEEEFKDRPHLR